MVQIWDRNQSMTLLLILFDFAKVPNLVQVLKEAIAWEEHEVAAPPKVREKYYQELKKELLMFPMMFEIREEIEKE